MAKLLKSRYSQAPQVIEFTFNDNDTMVNTAGAEVDFGRTNTAATTVEAIRLPVGAVVIDGEWVTETGFDATTYTVAVGDSASATRYMAATDVKAAGRTALTLTGYRVTDATDHLRITFTPSDVTTAGKATLRVMFVIPGRAAEVTGSPV